jgi:predicted MFS family arabinose efflux permease
MEGRVHTAFSLESVLDEVVFIAGPLVVTVAAAAVSPVLSLAVAAAAVGLGGAVLLAQRGTEPPPTGAAASAGTSVLRSRAMLALLVVFLAVGGVFGAVEVVTVAFTDERGAPAAAGAVLAAYAVGSLVAGLGYGAVQWSSPPGRRFVLAAVAMAVGLLPLPVVGSVLALGVALFVAGFAISPTLIAGNALVRSVVDPSRVTEGLTWVSTSLGIGVAAGAAAGGAWVDAAGARSALVLPVLCGVAAAVASIVGRRPLLGARR